MPKEASSNETAATPEDHSTPQRSRTRNSAASTKMTRTLNAGIDPPSEASPEPSLAPSPLLLGVFAIIGTATWIVEHVDTAASERAAQAEETEERR